MQTDTRRGRRALTYTVAVTLVLSGCVLLAGWLCHCLCARAGWTTSSMRSTTGRRYSPILDLSR